MWFRVIAERFDWMPRRGFMVGYRRGDIGYGTRACIARGLALGAIEKITRPEGYSVNKAGAVTRDV